MKIVPVSQKQAKEFIHRLHRHCMPPLTAVFSIGLEDDGKLIGVAMVGLPKARMSCDGATLEVNRTCTDGTPNANSMLYGACARAAKALGWSRLLTYTLPSETGASLKAAGWICLGEIDAGGSWQEKRGRTACQFDLFGERKIPVGPKLKWEKILVQTDKSGCPSSEIQLV